MRNEHQMKQLLETYEGRLLRYVHRFVPLEIARDIVQETFVRLWQSQDVDSYVGPWLFKVARRLAFDHNKREDTKMFQRNDPDVISEVIDDSETPEDSLSTHQQKIEIWKQIQSLPQAHKEVLLLKFQEDFSYKEISAVTGHSVSYVGVLIHEGMMTLRKHMLSQSSKGASHE
ncbi:MAG: sigma-70 family RNA polymerase sigma factor [Bdellovibrionaceae bacterium]|nr:sigma-70 family RNA polymerase sigma factor [Pseudobdellovibrionaceae bacterium]